MYSKYLKLLRFQDQYLPIGFSLAAGIYLQQREWWIIVWAIGMTFISFTAAITNEVVDKNDTDKYSWNKKIHISQKEVFDPRIVATLFIIFSLSGLLITYKIGLLWWGLTFYLTGLFYSLKPIRLKVRFALDLITQLFGWWILPFLAPIWKVGAAGNILPFMLVMTLLILSIYFPYELADYFADLKAGVKPTHIVLGMRNSLVFGLLVGTLGVSLYFRSNILQVAPWSLAFFLPSVGVIFLYLYWLKMKSITKQTQSIQVYVGWARPITQLLLLYFVYLYFR